MAAKEIWHVWDGDLSKDMSFIKQVTGVRFSDGSFIIVDEQSSYRSKPVMWYLWGDWCDSGVRAYTLGETRERVECECCEDWNYKGLKCDICKGRDYIWKTGEGK